MKQKSENQKALPKFFKLLAVAGLIGGVLGSLSSVAGYFWQEHDLGAAFARMLNAGSLWGMLACSAVLLGIGLRLYRSARNAFRSWDGEDETVMEQADEQLSWAMMLENLTMIVSFFCFSVGTAGIADGQLRRLVLLLVLFIAVLVLAVLLQQKTVDLVKEMNPEKKGSIYDEKFQKLWWESCDEAERRQIGQASYKAYSTASKFCAYFWGALFLGNMIFDYGFLPGAAVLVVWGVLIVSYTREAVRLGRRGQKTE